MTAGGERGTRGPLRVKKKDSSARAMANTENVALLQVGVLVAAGMVSYRATTVGVSIHTTLTIRVTQELIEASPLNNEINRTVVWLKTGGKA
jgi:hypothetical protein